MGILGSYDLFGPKKAQTFTMMCDETFDKLHMASLGHDGLTGSLDHFVMKMHHVNTLHYNDNNNDI